MAVSAIVVIQKNGERSVKWDGDFPKGIGISLFGFGVGWAVKDPGPYFRTAVNNALI
jgi:hypothetical protein